MTIRLTALTATYAAFAAALVFVGPPALAEEARAEREKLEAGMYALKPLSNDFQRLATIAGTWHGQKKDHNGQWMDIVVEYRLTSGNSALVETLLKDSPMEMVSIYHDDGDSIMMTHYCGLGNQPRMRASGFDDNELRFKFVDGSNMASPTETHMGSLTLTLLDENRIRQQRQLIEDGVPQPDRSEAFELTRVTAP